ncbi:MAG TPA: preprotein translocase subunit YajC [Mogibacterium sp.]|nr:preprotein translocase subunit YajC [Mogibacterium sp.]
MTNNPIGNIALLAGFILLIYFMMIRPQKKKEKADREMRSALQVGDEIMTIGGVIGKVIKITDKSIVVTTGTERNKIEFIKTAIASVNKGEKAQAATKKEESLVSDTDSKVTNEKKVTPKKLTKKSDE